MSNFLIQNKKFTFYRDGMIFLCMPLFRVKKERITLTDSPIDLQGVLSRPLHPPSVLSIKLFKAP